MIVDASVSLEWFVPGEPLAADAAKVLALALIESLGLARIGNGHDLLTAAAGFACDWGVAGYDAVYLAAAAMGDGVWPTADAGAARKVRRPNLVHLLGS